MARYVDPEFFEKEFQKSVAQGSPTNGLIQCFEKIARHYYRVFRSLNPTDDNAIINYAVSECWRKWDKYKKERSTNIFSFYTTVISNDLKTHYNKITQKKHKAKFISIDSMFSNKNGD